MHEEFKKFVRGKPELADYVSKGEMTWQKFYELYDLYGSENSIWEKYSSSRTGITDSISKITDMVKSVDVDSLKSNIDTAQKAIDFVTDLTTKKTPEVSFKGPSTPRPLNKFFED